MASPYYLSAKQAANALGVTPATLYAYASRGQLRSEPSPGRTRERRYLREDIERLKERKEARRDPTKAAAAGLQWGSPVLQSAITLIHDGRFYYRGIDATRLAGTASLEETALLIWAASEREHNSLLNQRSVLSLSQLRALRRSTKEPVTTLQMALPLAGAIDGASYDLRPMAVRQTGARILRLFAAAIARHEAHVPIHQALQRAWTPKREGVGDILRTALVLCADHELNISAFAARCAASAGAAPYDVASAAMATLKGFRHGGVAEPMRALFSEVGSAAQARSVVISRLRRGEPLPGFGHRLYPNGDPRGALLLKLAEASGNDEEYRKIRAVWKAGTELTGDRPNLDFGLAAVTQTYGLPQSAPLLLFAVGRTVGWIAHAIEEYGSGRLIRPRAHYVGPAPANAS